MGKKAKEFKSGDFIFAKVKGYPAWPARVQKLNGKKYFVYFYGTGETANLPPNMIFDYAENKDKFLTKTVKRRDFNDGVKQIEYDYANNVPLEQVIGVPMEVGEEGPANDTADDSAIDTTMDETVADTTADDTEANDTVAEDANTTQNDAAVEDSDEAGALVIDEGKVPAKGKKSTAKTPAKEAPKAKEARTPRGKAKKDEANKDEAKDKKEEKPDEELVSRSGRKIRPKKYMDEQTEENATLPSPAHKRRRGASPEKEKADKEKADKEKESAKEKEAKADKNITQFNAVKQSELEGLKAPFKPADEDKDNILIAYLPNNSYAGIKLFQSRPVTFKNEATRLQWDKLAAANAITLKMQLERDQITPESVQGQLVMDLNLTDEEKATLAKERETDEKKSRVNFLKTEMRLIELDTKIKSCLCLEKADTELCLKLLDDLLELEVKPLMLLKHPTCLETVKRMRAYVGNTPSWDLSESAALVFSKQAHRIRKKADMLYKAMKELFQTPDGLSFWEFFSERVLVFKKFSSNLHPSDLLELVHEPIELSQPYAHTMRAAIDEANNSVPPLPDGDEEEEEEKQVKKKGSGGKGKKSAATSTPSKPKRQSSRNKNEEEKEKPSPEQLSEPSKPIEGTVEEPENEQLDKAEEKEEAGKVEEGSAEKESKESKQDTPKEAESAPQEANEDVEMAEPEKAPETEQNSTDAPEKEAETTTPTESEVSEKNAEAEKNTKENKAEKAKETDKPKEEKSSKRDKKAKESDSEKSSKDEESDKSGKDTEKSAKDTEKSAKDTEKSAKDSAKASDKSPKSSKDNDKHSRDGDKSDRKEKRSGRDRDSSSKDKNGKDSEKSGKDKEDKSDDKAEAKDDKVNEKERHESGEPRAKRSRESKKTDPPPRSPAKRKSKF